MHGPAPRHWSAILLGFGLLATGAFPLGNLLNGSHADPVARLAGLSDLVVLADVVAVDEPASQWPQRLSTARLRVRETWKGRHTPTLTVPFDSALLWPAPPRFVAGETIVVFLTKGARGWATTTGTAEGTLRPPRTEIECLRRHVTSQG